MESGNITGAERLGWLPGPIWPGTNGGGPGSCGIAELSGGPDIQVDPLSTCIELPTWGLNSDPKCEPPALKRQPSRKVKNCQAETIIQSRL